VIGSCYRNFVDLGRRGGNSLTPAGFLVIFERFARTPPEVCFYSGGVGKPKGLSKAWGCSRVRSIWPSQTGFRNRSLLAEGRKQSLRCPRVPPPWRGYAGRNWRYGAGFSQGQLGKRPANRRGSRLKSGTETDAKQPPRAFCVFVRMIFRTAPDSPAKPCARLMGGWLQVLEGF
jgi:hypothetical protein